MFGVEGNAPPEQTARCQQGAAADTHQDACVVLIQ